MAPEIYKLHANVWWGALMAVLGLFYVIRFRPRAGESLTGRADKPPSERSK
jgi:hypothetical protein